MTFKEMKKTLLKLSDGVVCHSSAKSVALPKVQIKQEPIEILYNDQGAEQVDEYDNIGASYDYQDQDEEQYPECSNDEEIYYSTPGYGKGNFRGNRHHPQSQRGRGSFRGKGSYSSRGHPTATYNRNSNFKQNNTNRINRTTGRISECTICRSIMHWASECPHKDDPEKKANPEIILKVDSVMLDEDYLTLISTGTNNLDLIDSGASKTVC